MLHFVRWNEWIVQVRLSYFSEHKRFLTLFLGKEMWPYFRVLNTIHQEDNYDESFSELNDINLLRFAKINFSRQFIIG
jgi:hypothetical protein